METNIAKRARHADEPPTSDQKCYINELPDEILVIILSGLPVKEAARTSVLSRRWRRNLWAYSTSLDFDFDAEDTLRRLYNYGYETIVYEGHKFVGCVNLVLKTHKGSTLDGLRIAYNMEFYGMEFYSSCIRTTVDKWVEFAILKRVRRLELDMTASLGIHFSPLCYRFPSRLLNVPNFVRLTALCLKSISIMDADVAYLLSTCLMLETLVVKNARCITDVRIFGQALKLSHLEISYCRSIMTMDILSAPNLSFFRYVGPTISISFGNVPKLSLLSLGNTCSQTLYIRFQRHLYPSWLKKLELDLISGNETYRQCYLNVPINFLKFSNLEQLILKFIATEEEEDKTLYTLISIIGAYPSLHKLTLKYKKMDKVTTKKRSPNSEPKEEEQLHMPFLKVIEFVGWVGVKSDVQLANYLIASASNLENLILDLHVPHFRKKSWRGDYYPLRERYGPESTNREAAVSRAMQLEKKLSPHLS